MGRCLRLPGLLLSLPLVTGWTTSECLVTESSRRHLVSRYFAFLPSDTKLSFLVACFSVTNLTETLEVVPRNVEGLSLGGSVSSLPQGAFSALPELKVLVLSMHLKQLQPGALQGLGHLQQLSFIGTVPGKRPLILCPDAFDDLISLQKLNFFGFCLEKKAAVRLPPSLRHLVFKNSCLQDVGELAGMFPDLVHGSSSGDTWTLDILDLSFNMKLKKASPGSLQGLKLDTLRLDRTKLEAGAVRALGLQRLNALSVPSTDTAELPTQVVTQFELQELNVGSNKIGYIPQEALASCHSLKSLFLGSTGLTTLPPGFLAAMPRLQSLNLAGNRLQRVTLCMNETGAASALWTLDLSQNGLRVLSPATFSCLPHLRKLLLQGNQLLFLEGQVFQGLQQLETLMLDKNPLLNLGEDWLVALPALTTLSLLDTHIAMIPTSAFWGAESLHTLRLTLPSAPRGAVLFLPRTLTSLELHAASNMERWKLVPNVFPVLQTLTIKGRGLQLGVHNASEVFPALHQLSLLGSSLEVFCFQGTSNLFFWQFPKLQSLWVRDSWSNPRPCYITGLPSLWKLTLKYLQPSAQPRSVQLEELVGELPQLQELRLCSTGLKSLSATAFQRLGRLQVLVLDNEKDLILDDSLQAYSPQMPQYIYILVSNLACQCVNAWVGLWLKGSPNTYLCILTRQTCRTEAEGRSSHSLFPFLWNHCPQTLELELFGGSFALLILLIFLPILQEARNFWVLYLQALFRAWLRGLRDQKDERKRFLYDIFVSHCRQDQDWVMQELLPALEGGLRLCLPERDFEPGKDVADNVTDSMMGSRVTLCVLSRQALCTPRCRLELRLATSLFLAAPFPPVLLLIFLEPISRHQLPRYHRLARLLRRGDYCLWPQEEERKEGFWAWLRSRLRQPGLE